MSGLHLVFEGPDSVGKSTQIELVKNLIESLGFEVIITKEPGGTELGQHLRNILLDSDLDIDYKAETLLMAADRAQHVSKKIVPLLKENKVVLSDRYIPSSLVYQGIVRGVGVDLVNEINMFAVGKHKPDLILCFDLEDDAAKQRMSSTPDRIEREGDEFAQRIREAYRELQVKYNWQRVDANGTQQQVFNRIKNLIEPLLLNHSN
ncbi:MAG: dTMP kinase [Acidimicrobiia bacterium]